jgi:hypothetical protein
MKAVVIHMNSWFTIIISALLTALVTSCSTTRLPADQELKVINSLQGTWDGKQYESGLWRVYGDSKTGDTNAQGTMVFNGPKVTVSTLNTPNPFWRRDEDQHPRKQSVSYERVYVVNADFEVVFPDSCNIHKMIFRFTGPDTLEGYQNDFPGFQWRYQRVMGE